MGWIRYIILAILLLLSLWVAYHKYMPRKSKFWKNQPVTRKGMNDKTTIGQILDNPLSDQHKDLIKSGNIDPVDHKSWNSFVELINTHYFEGVQYNADYLEWELKKGEESYNSWLLHTNDYSKVIGGISMLPIKLLIAADHESEKHFNYVDHLTVVEDERGKGIATKLISKVIDVGVNRSVPRFIYRIEMKPLPYPYLCKLSNYFSQISRGTKKHTDQKDLTNYQKYNNTSSSLNNLSNLSDQLYKFWRKRVELHKIAFVMDQKEWESYASSSSVVTTYYWMNENDNDNDNNENDNNKNDNNENDNNENNNKVGGLLIGLKTKFRGDTVTEIVFVRCNDNKVDQKRMLECINALETKWITMHNYSDHNRWIKMMKMKKSHDLYIHLYNYHHPRIKPKELHFGMG